jgi:hypothetical protein
MVVDLTLKASKLPVSGRWCIKSRDSEGEQLRAAHSVRTRNDEKVCYGDGRWWASQVVRVNS